jgi:hypothetical protein
MIKEMIVERAKMEFTEGVCSLSAIASGLLTDEDAFSIVSVCIEIEAWSCFREPGVKLENNLTAKKVPIIALVFIFIPLFLFKAHQDADLHVDHLPTKWASLAAVFEPIR